MYHRGREVGLYLMSMSLAMARRRLCYSLCAHPPEPFLNSNVIILLSAPNAKTLAFSLLCYFYSVSRYFLEGKSQVQIPCLTILACN